MKIRQLRQDENPPMDLLLLADPSRESIADYLERGECYIAENKAGKVIAVYVLLSTRPKTAELVNIAVCEEEQEKGIGKKLLLNAVQRARLKGYKRWKLVLEIPVSASLHSIKNADLGSQLLIMISLQGIMRKRFMKMEFGAEI